MSELTEHITYLVQHHRITMASTNEALRYIPVNFPISLFAVVWPLERVISAPAVGGCLSYAANLHEIGHVCMGHGSRPSYDLYSVEVEAWDWAQSNALTWTPTMQRLRDVCLRVYRHHLGIQSRLRLPR
jgi:hypothetical protein